jgi:hypothetical protein
MTPGVYCASCECGRVYVGQSIPSNQTRIKEHHLHIRLAQPEKSAVAEHSISHDHTIRLQNTIILSTKTNYMARLIREATGIELYANDMNRKDGFTLSTTWKPLHPLLK